MKRGRKMKLRNISAEITFDELRNEFFFGGRFRFRRLFNWSTAELVDSQSASSSNSELVDRYDSRKGVDQWDSISCRWRY